MQDIARRVMLEHACMDAQLRELYEVLGCPDTRGPRTPPHVSTRDTLRSIVFADPVPLPFNPDSVALEPSSPFWEPEYILSCALNEPAHLTEQSVLGALGLNTILGARRNAEIRYIPIHLPVKRLLQDPTITSIRAYPPPAHVTNHADVLLMANLPAMDSSKASLPKMRRALGFASVPAPQRMEADSFWNQNLQRNVSAIVQANSYSSGENSEQHTPAFESLHQVHSTDTSEDDSGRLTAALKYSAFPPPEEPAFDTYEIKKQPETFSASLQKMCRQGKTVAPADSRPGRHLLSAGRSPAFRKLVACIKAVPSVALREPIMITQYTNADQVIVRTSQQSMSDGLAAIKPGLEQSQSMTIQLSPQKGKDPMECELFGLQPIYPYDPVPLTSPDQDSALDNTKHHSGLSPVCLSSFTLEKANELRTISDVPFSFGSLRAVLSIGDKFTKSMVMPTLTSLLSSAFVGDQTVFPVLNILSTTAEYKRLLSKARFNQFTRMAVRRVFQHLSSISSQLLTNQDPERFVSAFASVETKCELSGKTLLAEVQNIARIIPVVSDFALGASSKLLTTSAVGDLAGSTKSASVPAIQMLALNTVASSYSLNTNIPALTGFMRTATADQTAESFRTHPTLCHFLIALLAHQQTSVYLPPPYCSSSNDPLLYTNSAGILQDFDDTIAEGSTMQDRMSALLPHILIAIRDTYTLVPSLLIPEPVPVTEAVLTALNYMVSPSSALIEELFPMCVPSNNGKHLKFTSTESPFDSTSRTPIQDTGPFFQGYFDPMSAVLVPQITSKIETKPECTGKVEPPLKHQKLPPIPDNEILTFAVRANTLLQTVTGIPPCQEDPSATLLLAHTVLSNSVSKNIVCTADLFRRHRDLSDIGPSDDVLSDALLMMAPSKTLITFAQRNSLDSLMRSVITPIRLQSIQYNTADYFSFISDATPSRKTEAAFSGSQTAFENKGKGASERLFSDIKGSIQMTGQTKGAILAITSPLLGEYRLMTQTPNSETNTQKQEAPQLQASTTYYGIDITLVNALGYAVSYLLSLDAQEYNLSTQIVPDDLMTPNIAYPYVQMRLNAVARGRQDRHNTMTLKDVTFKYTNSEVLAFRAQERMRFCLLPNYQYTYIIRGHRTPVPPLQRSMTQRLPEVPASATVMPRIITKAAVVRDTLARLAGRFGTINDIADLCCDSSFFFYPEDAKLNSTISTIMDRVHQIVYNKEEDRKVCMYLQNLKVWVYMHAKIELMHDPVLQKDDRVFENYPCGIDNIYNRAK